MRLTPLYFAVLLFAACSSGTPSTEVPDTRIAPTPEASTPSTFRAPETAERDSWQKPQEVFLLMGNDLRDRTIADLAAGDGYFTFKLIEVGANVIAISDDPAELAAIEARKKEMKLGDDRLRTRLATPNDPGLVKDEVDACLLVHAYTRIPDKKAYLTRVYEGTKMPKPLFILEWLNTETPMGPPMTDRISSERVMDDIGLAGYTDVGTYSAKIPHQAFIFASHQSGLADDQQGMDPSQLLPGN
ncbi:MAG: class I SAM-dependent methyltransferase [Flavobacteriales bacterium]|nr:class I SAM-dependent methyltransferase [Flavobacteriales bacterium]